MHAAGVIDRMSANICRDTATSAIWNVLRMVIVWAAAIKLFCFRQDSAYICC